MSDRKLNVNIDSCCCCQLEGRSYCFPSISGSCVWALSSLIYINFVIFVLRHRIWTDSTKLTYMANNTEVPFEEEPLFEKEFGDYSAFYTTITICAVLGAFLFLLNIVFGCCSKYKHYWEDGNTGNRWLVSIWTKTPHNQPPLDYTELEKTVSHKVCDTDLPEGYMELKKRESDL